MRNLSTILILLINFLAAHAEQKLEMDSERYVEKTNKLSFIPPKGWKCVGNEEIKIFLGDDLEDFTPKIMLHLDKVQKETMKEFVDNAVHILGDFGNDFKKLSISDEKLDSGVITVKLVTTHLRDKEGLLLKEIFYFFDFGGKKYIASCIAPAAASDQLFQFMEKCIKTITKE